MLVLAAGLAVAVPVLGVHEPGADELERNRRRLEEWRADPEHHQRLWRDLRAFYALPPERQNQMRQLDRQLHQADWFTRNRLWGVLDRYVTWLERLPEEERRQVLGTANQEERLALIRLLRERQWVERLPAGVRAELDKLPTEAQRRQRIQQLRREADKQRIRWKRLAPRDNQALRPVKLEQFLPAVQQFVEKALKPMLSAREKAQLDNAEGKRWPTLARLVLRLSEQHPVLPPLGGKEVRNFGQLPPEVKRLLVRREPDGQKRWGLLRPTHGKWPDYALAVTRLVGENSSEEVPPLGASRPGEFPAPINQFLDEQLPYILNEVEAKELRALEGHWPDYPHRLLELARRKHFVIPGMSLPGPRDLWERARLVSR
jgi:hypothetical protein